MRNFALTNVGGDGDATLVTDDANHVYVLFKLQRARLRAAVDPRKYDEFGNMLAETGPLDVAHGLTRIGNTLLRVQASCTRDPGVDLDLAAAADFTRAAARASTRRTRSEIRPRDGNLLLTGYYTHGAAPR